MYVTRKKVENPKEAKYKNKQEEAKKPTAPKPNANDRDERAAQKYAAQVQRRALVVSRFFF